MPKRTDISKILIIGSGPIVIGQSAEFDYSGTQACKALKAEGYEVVLANSNPATIMTDPELADRTYIEPLTREYLEEIIRIEARDVAGRGLRAAAHRRRTDRAEPRRRSCRWRRARQVQRAADRRQLEAIKKAEDRLLFKDAMQKIGLDVPKSALVNNIERRPRVRRQDRLSGHHPPIVHAGRHRRRHRLQPRRADAKCWPAASISRRCTKR